MCQPSGFKVPWDILLLDNRVLGLATAAHYQDWCDCHGGKSSSGAELLAGQKQSLWLYLKN